MANLLAEWLNQRGIEVEDSDKDAALRYYRTASFFSPSWSAPIYNCGLTEKYRGNWASSLRYNKRAVALNPSDEAGWWNLGIAATALRDWKEARRAWTALKIPVNTAEGEVLAAEHHCCVRLNPNDDGEVVWGVRIDPARTIILSVPLPASGHRFHDIILNDGAQEGTRRSSADEEVPVFNELEVWQRSEYSTFGVALTVPDEQAKQSLVRICEEFQLGVEDYSTINFICAECSRGNPKPHKCTTPTGEMSHFGFGAKAETDVDKALRQWVQLNPGADYGDIELLLAADS